MNKYTDEYRSKLRTPEEAVQVVRSGDWIDYTTNFGFPILLDEALAKRRDFRTCPESYLRKHRLRQGYAFIQDRPDRSRLPYRKQILFLHKSQ